MERMSFDIFNRPDGASTSRRRIVPETGSFGKSTRRSRSRTNTPGAKKPEDPSAAAIDRIFSQFTADAAARAAENAPRKGKLSTSVTQPNLSSNNVLTPTDGNSDASKRYVHKEPTEVILRGFKSTQQYAAIREYERIAGRICEDYPRDPPVEQRRYRSDLRDPAVLRTVPLTQEERAKAMRYAGGENWIKITFESAEAAQVAINNSPQTVLANIVSAELYRGQPPSNTDEVSVNAGHTAQHTPRLRRSSRAASGTLPRSFTPGGHSLSPSGSHASSQTLDSATLSTATASSATITTPYRQTMSHAGTSDQDENSPIFCSRIPTAKRIKLLPAEQALLPQKSYTQRLLANIPLIGWVSSDIIGNQVPKTEAGEFDWGRASLYWKLIYWVDGMTGWFDIAGADKEDNEKDE